MGMHVHGLGDARRRVDRLGAHERAAGVGRGAQEAHLLPAPRMAAGLEEARVPHTHVTAYIKAEGSRLTELAAMARMTLPAMSELVDDLQRLGIVERRPDPRDGRAKLICLTESGREAMRTARRIIGEIEGEYAALVGVESFEAAAQTLDGLLRELRTRHPPATSA
jgi:DNA-binding MarR family transcriptional regulator